jgi:hypothetical protein
MKNFKFFNTEERELYKEYDYILKDFHGEEKKFMFRMIYAVYTFEYDSDYVDRTTHKTEYGIVKLLKTESSGRRTQDVVLSIKPNGGDVVKVLIFRYDYYSPDNILELISYKNYSGNGLNIRNVIDLL